MNLTDILPKELNETLNSSEFDDEAGLLIESVKYIDDDIYLTFSIRLYGNIIHQIWQIKISGVENEQIKREWTQNIEIYIDHPLLLEYTDIHTELYFKGTTTNSETLFVEIHQSLMQMADNINDISKYLLSPEGIKELSQQGYGLFARGPKTILKIYERCIARQGIKPIYIGENEPPPANKLLKLLKIGSSYFIGQAFEFERKQ